jgi:hypothetical protein
MPTPDHGVHHRHRAQSAEDRVARRNHRQDRREDKQRHPFAEQRAHEQAARIERGRKIDQHVAGQEQSRNQRPDAASAITLFQQFGDGGALLAVIDRHEHKGEDQQAEEPADLPPRQQRHLVAVHPYQLIGGKVGERDRARHEQPRQLAPGKVDILRRTIMRGAADGKPCRQPDGSGQADAHRDLDQAAGRHGIEHCVLSPLDWRGYSALTAAGQGLRQSSSPAPRGEVLLGTRAARWRGDDTGVRAGTWRHG